MIEAQYADAKIMKEQQFRISALDGWRAISVSLVIACHLATVSSIAIKPRGEVGQLVLVPLLNESGKLGVSIFFVISGYVITRGLIREYDAVGRISLTGFYLRRIFRILPPLLIYVSVVMALAATGGLPSEALGVVKTLTFTCNFTDCGGWFGAHTWSLSYEEQFYLVIPISFFLLWSSNGIVFYLLPAFLIVATLLFSLLDQQMGNFVSSFIAIAAGVAWASKESSVIDLCRSIPQSLGALSPVLLIVTERLTDTRFWTVGASLSPIFITFMLVHSAFISVHLRQKLSLPWLTHFGKISYSIYLWQEVATFPFPGAGLWFYFGSVSACALWSSLSYKLIESPLIGFSRSLCRWPPQTIDLR
jgi:peptidoglycan/LPS O-acetylase OafA/YrhL